MSSTILFAEILTDEWFVYYESKFSDPDCFIEESYKDTLDNLLISHLNPNFVVSATSVENTVQKLK